MAGRIALFSAGMDSMIMQSLLKISLKECLFVDMGTIENQLEKQYIEQYYPAVLQISFPLSIHELPNKIIPYRNNHLALIAANYGTEIYFAFTAGDTTRDKDYVFKAQMECILNYFAQVGDKAKFLPPYTLHMPFKHMTKTQMVARYIEEGNDPYELLAKSCSCYEPIHNMPCGRCRSCIRKFIALELNKINTQDFFNESPANHILSFYEESKKKNRKQELKEIELWIHMNNFGDII